MIFFWILYVVALFICVTAFAAIQYPSYFLQGEVRDDLPEIYKWLPLILGIIPVANLGMAGYIIYCTEVAD